MKVSEPITILIPIRNGIQFVLEAIESIESNIFGLDEVIAIDDGSTDGTSEILANWQAKNSRVRILPGSSSGLVDALNLGLQNASNKWVARFDVDDSYSLNRLSEQRKWINTNVALIFSDYEIKSINNLSLGTIHSAVFHPAVSLSLITSSRTPHPVALMNRMIALDAGGYKLADFPAEDLSLWLRMSRLGSLVSVPLPLLHYRIHEDSITSNKSEEMKLKTKELMNYFGICSQDLAILEQTWAEIYTDYRFFTYSDERRILFLRDLFALSRLYPELTWVKKAKLSILVKLLSNPLVIYKIFVMKLKQTSRRSQRKAG
jgi:glycosyltransferase involved in cell wall biosynthesis